ncbi:hypothetical protein ACFV4F_32550 [Kitasatospora sp. NPDC059722]|uniref:hypothetical protein n=1 Tax=unclassified Kitasatospora TaxID=2633591 RepID=UPI003652DE8A
MTAQRSGIPSAVLVTALLVLPLLLVTLASLPALLVLPFLPRGAARADRLVRQLSCWTGRLMPAPSR